MTTVANTESFEEKMKNRIKDSIGDLITDEQLTSLINKAMNETFLKPTYREEGMGYNSRKVEVPPFLHTVVKELLTEQVKSAVAVYIDENKESIEKSVTDLIKNG